MTRLIVLAGVTVALLALGGCGYFRGAKDFETGSAAENIGTGPGLLTGKRGGIVIFQR